MPPRVPPTRPPSPSSRTASCPRPTCATSSGSCARTSTSGPLRSRSGCGVDRPGASASIIEGLMEDALLAVVAIAAFTAAVIWGRSASHRARVLQRVRRNSVDPDARELARSDYRKDLHTAGLYGAIALAAAAASLVGG